jgi:ribonuclease-3
VRAEGPDHAKEFFATVSIEGSVRGTGSGRSKKQAEQEAARMALARLGPSNDDDGSGAARGPANQNGGDDA